MALGYDGKLYILAFDHRGSFQKKMFGIQGDPTPEETERIADAKRLIFEGMLDAVSEGAEAGATGVLVDEEFGSAFPSGLASMGSSWRCRSRSPARRSSTSITATTSALTSEVQPDLEGVRPLQPRRRHRHEREQLGRLKRLADWLHQRRKFLFELWYPRPTSSSRLSSATATATTPSSGPS